jgi:hypothetical protein
MTNLINNLASSLLKLALKRFSKILKKFLGCKTNKKNINKLLINKPSFRTQINIFSSIFKQIKKLLSLILFYSLIYSQIFFSFLLTDSILRTIVERIDSKSPLTLSFISNLQFISSAQAYDAITPPQNITDNPINHIEVDNTIPINNGDTATTGAGKGNGNNAYLDRA